VATGINVTKKSSADVDMARSRQAPVMPFFSASAAV
jgi:hypothetical protein